MSAPTVFITVPKYVAITPITQATTAGILPKIKPAPQNNVTITPVVGAGSFTTSDSESNSSIPAPKGKKRRLDHLSWEEKIQRKKLKNRVAAQTSRDRKKARMEEMESEIKDLTARTEILVNKCESLQVINDSLLEKNQKLDMEVEQLRQQLQELQKQQPQHTVTTCAGCESLLNGSAVSNTTDPLPQGSNPKDSQSTQELNVLKLKQELKKSTTVSSLWRVIALCLLYKILLPDIEIDEGALNDAEFDAGKLEELAESLLADITADLEACDREGNETSAQVTSGTERLLGPMVGTTTECLESSQHTSQNGCGLSTTITPTTNTDTQNQVPALQIPDLLLESNLENENNNNNDDNVTMKEVSPMITLTASESKPSANATTTEITPDTVYGTYDAKTNSITVVMDDVAVPVNEVVEEIYWDGERSSSTEDMIYSSSAGVASPSQVFLNVNASCNENENMMEDDNDDDNGDDLNFDPIAKFLCPKRPLVSPLAKSPASSFHSATSDHGYESILGSPSSHYEPLSEDMTSDFSDWPPGFNELFPGLI
ncbi:LOW QUALITY PROTEIN: X box binding protein 1 [Haematobia irritans]|uniref:LOW QUALITY PROTEIN: X box binding protein 1 n=1 Tax=Haematobia irritans TaxID=7368 RepID=UPI003F4F4D2E